MPPPKRRARSAWIDLRAGLRFARRHPLIPQLLFLIASLAVFGTPAVTMAPLFAKNLLGVGPEGLGGMLSAVGLGAVAMALLMASAGDFRRKGAGTLAAASGFALSLAGLALSRSYGLSLAFLALLGGSMTSTASLVNTLLQKNAPDRMRGRVISLYALAWLGLVPLGSLQAGIVAQRFGAATPLLFGAAGITITLVVLRLFRPVPLEAE
jgi:predicted MFS family arabinose efflux permease